jgi:uncharacterized protein YndB with AHSA1/START domain
VATILLRVPIEADENAIYETVTKPDGVAAWWSNRTEGPLGAGSVMKVTFPDTPMTFDLEVEEEQPPRRVAWKVLAGPPEWVGTTISFDIESDAERNKSLLFKQDGWASTEESFPFITYAWAQILPRLKERAETGKANPFFNF